jgi:hypothetical protein
MLLDIVIRVLNDSQCGPFVEKTGLFGAMIVGSTRERVLHGSTGPRVRRHVTRPRW